MITSSRAVHPQRESDAADAETPLRSTPDVPTPERRMRSFLCDGKTHRVDARPLVEGVSIVTKCERHVDKG